MVGRTKLTAMLAPGVARNLSRCSSLSSPMRRTCNQAPFSKPALTLPLGQFL